MHQDDQSRPGPSHRGAPVLLLGAFLLALSLGNAGCDRKVKFTQRDFPVEQTLVVLNGERLPLEEFDSEFRLMSIYYSGITGLKMRDTKRQLFDQIVDRRLMVQEALKSGYSVSQRELEKSLREELRDSPSGLLDQLTSQGIEKQIWKNKMAQELLVAKFAEGEIYPRAKVAGSVVEEYYWGHLNDFWVSDALRARHLVVMTKAELSKAQACLKSGEPFGAVCSKFSVDPQKDAGGDWGWIPSDGLSPLYVRTLRALKPGEVSNPVKDAFGYHLFQLLETRPTRVRSLKEAKPLVRELLLQREKDRLYAEWLAGIKKNAKVEVNPELSAVVGIVWEDTSVPVKKPKSKKRKSAPRPVAH